MKCNKCKKKTAKAGMAYCYNCLRVIRRTVNKVFVEADFESLQQEIRDDIGRCKSLEGLSEVLGRWSSYIDSLQDIQDLRSCRRGN